MEERLEDGIIIQIVSTRYDFIEFHAFCPHMHGTQRRNVVLECDAGDRNCWSIKHELDAVSKHIAAKVLEVVGDGLMLKSVLIDNMIRSGMLLRSNA